MQPGPITSSCLPPDGIECDKIIVAIYDMEAIENKQRYPDDFVVLDHTTANELKAHNIMMAWLEDHRNSGSFMIKIGIGYMDGSWPVIDSVLDSITFRTGGTKR